MKEPNILAKQALAVSSLRSNVKKKLLNLIGLKAVKTLLEKHPFGVSTLIRPEGNSTIFEVEHLYYDDKLEPVTIVRKYGETGLFSFRNDSLLGFKEYKKLPSETEALV